MNDEKEKEQLLNDLLMGESFDQFGSQVREQALKALRRRRLMRQIRPVAMAIVFVVLMAVVAGRWQQQTDKEMVHLQIEPKPEPAPEAELPPPSAPAKVSFTISDEELLSLFPTGTCFLAEGNGSKMLVFTDDEVRRLVFREN